MHYISIICILQVRDDIQRCRTTWLKPKRDKQLQNQKKAGLLNLLLPLFSLIKLEVRDSKHLHWHLFIHSVNT